LLINEPSQWQAYRGVELFEDEHPAAIGVGPRL